MGMDVELKRLIREDTPQLNPLLANGLATEHMKHVESYVDNVFVSTAKGYPEGFKYLGWMPCSPQEEYNEITRKRIKRQYDVARSDIYYIKLLFEYKGEKIIRYLALPFVSVGGNITLGGSRFNISPVISDRVISIGVSSIFVRLLRDRLTFEVVGHSFFMNGVTRTEKVANSTIYHKNAKMKKIKPTVNMKCALTHYLFCKYGFYETFQMFGKCTPVVGTDVEINERTHPQEHWVVCESRKMPLKGLGRGHQATTNVKIAIRKEDWSPMVSALVGGAFYVIDHFAGRCKPEFFKSRTLWKILMGHVIWSGALPEGWLIKEMDKHLVSLDEYIDTLVDEELKQIGCPVKDLYALFGIIIENFSDWVLGSANKINSVYDKQLKVLYYVMYEISSAAVKMMFRLKAASDKDAAAKMGIKKEMTLKEVIATMNSTLRTGLIYSITKGHGEVSNISSSGDNLAFKVTCNLVPQSNSSRQGSRKAKVVLGDPSKRLHVSVAEHCGYSFLPKSEPSGRSRLNLVSKIDSQGVLLRDPELAPMLDQVQHDITRGN